MADPVLARMQEDAAPGRSDYGFLRAISHTMGERNDCAVIAVAALTGLPYTVIHAAMAKAGRRRRCGTGNHITVGILRQNGYRLVDVTRSFTARTIRSIAPYFHADHKYLIFSSRHVSAVVNGKVEDWADERGLFVQRVHRVLGEWEPDPDITIPAPTPTGRYLLGARDRIRHLASEHLSERLKTANIDKAPRNRRWWLGLRAAIMADLEMRFNIRRTTASVELGLWQADVGYSMKELT